MKNNSSNNYISYTRNSCRLCLSEDIELAVNIGKSPISEKYVNKNHLEKLFKSIIRSLFL